MKNLHNLKFSVGEIGCVILFVQPDNSASKRVGNYYEHCHPCLELHYSISGYTDYVIDKREVRLGPGQIMMIPPRTYHKEVKETQDSSKMTLTLDVQVPSAEAGTSDKNFYKVFQRDREIIINANKGLLNEAFLRIRQIASEPLESYLAIEKLRAACHTLTVELYGALADADSPGADALADSSISREYEIDTFIATHFPQNNAKELLAETLHVSPRQLHRIIKKSYGKNYREKLSEMRVEIATSFLSQSDKSIGEIAEMLGYGSAANFSTFIKRATGKTPSQIRSEAAKRTPVQDDN